MKKTWFCVSYRRLYIGQLLQLTIQNLSFIILRSSHAPTTLRHRPYNHHAAARSGTVRLRTLSGAAQYEDTPGSAVHCAGVVRWGVDLCLGVE